MNKILLEQTNSIEFFDRYIKILQYRIQMSLVDDDSLAVIEFPKLIYK